jgi:hypothetical protein
MSFGSDLTKFNKKYVDVFSKVRRGSALNLFSAVVISTPVDKGTLRSNWFVGIGAGRTDVSDSVLPQASIINSIKQALLDVDVSKDVFLTNNLPYASAIEYDGHSAKAPRGMVRINLVNWDRIVESNIRKFK